MALNYRREQIPKSLASAASLNTRGRGMYLIPSLIIVLLTIFEIGKFGPALADSLAILHFAHGVDLGDKAKWKEAIVEYTEAIQLDNSLEGAFRNRGLVYAVMERTDQAAADAHQAIQLDPKDATAYWLCGLVHVDQNEKVNAKIDLERALSLGLDPEMQLTAERALRQLQ